MVESGYASIGSRYASNDTSYNSRSVNYLENCIMMLETIYMWMRSSQSSLPPFLIISAIAGITLVILGPYNTTTFSWPFRFVFWIGLCLLGGVGAYTTNEVVNKRKAVSSKWIRAFIQSLGATLAVFICLLTLTVFMKGWPSQIFYILVPFYIWVVSMAISTIGTLQIKEANEAPGRAAIYERLKPILRNADLFAISAEDHYVRVYTSNGEDLILMRFSDAVKETVPLLGLSVHRSWWVAEAGIKSSDQKNRKANIVLKNNLPVPVSRSNIKKLRKAGWI